MGILDEMFLLDYSKNRANILTVMKVSKVRDPGEFRQFLIDRITAFQRCRSKLVKTIFREYFWKEMYGHELNAATFKSFVILNSDDFKTEKDLQDFLAKE